MKRNPNPLVSVVILSWNTLDETRVCLENVRDLSYANKEIVVVDNGSDDGSKDFLREQKDITYVDLPKNTGFTGGQIAGYKVAKGDYLALINSDAVASPNWLDILVSLMEKDKKIGASGGRAYTWAPGEEPFETNRPFYSYQVVDPRRGYAATRTSGTETLAVDAISGAGVLVRRSAIDKVGYFDNRFFAYFEETDLFARMQRAGYTIVYEPSAHLWHKIGASTKTSRPYFYYRQFHRNRFIFALKNFDSKYARAFFDYYILEGVRAHYRYLRHKQMDDKGRVEGLWWNLARLPRTLVDRRKTLALGETYSKTIKSHKPARDITVVIPCFNYEPYVSEAIESVLSQSIKPTRVIVIDDGSSDGSLKEIEKYRKKGVEILSQENHGVVYTKNRGIQMSETSWTIFLDADDILEKDYFKKLLTKAEAGNFDIVYTDMTYFGAREGIHKAGRYSLGRLLGKGNFIHNSALIATHLLKQVGGYKEQMRGGYEDWELYITLAEAGARFGYVEEALLRYRQHESISGRNTEAEAKAKRLWDTVHELHTNSYRHYNRSFSKLENALKRLVRNPLLPLVALVSLPVVFLSGCKWFLIGAKRRLAYQIRSYLHKRDERARNKVPFDEM